MENEVKKRPMPPSYFIWAILSTAFCCLPFGIPAIVYAFKVDILYYNELYEEAQEASNKAKMWSIIAAVTGFFGILLYIIFIAFLLAVTAGSASDGSY